MKIPLTLESRSLCVTSSDLQSEHELRIALVGKLLVGTTSKFSLHRVQLSNWTIKHRSDYNKIVGGQKLQERDI